MVEVSVSVLSVKKENAISTFYNLETAKLDYFHIDSMDGKFVENNNLELMRDYALTISQISNIGLDVHLMVEDVETEIDYYVALKPRIITFHIEAIKNKEKILELINKIKENNVKVGLAISPNTDEKEIYEYLPYIHQVLVMTVEPGKGGQKLINETLAKIENINKYINENNLEIDIEADGGINKENSQEVIKTGCNILVAGSYIIASENYKEAIENLKEE